MELVDYVGYGAMLALMVSFTMKDIFKLRIINTVGCILFIVYGFMLDSLPIIITNSFITIVNIYQLTRKSS